ncbi:MAG: hypothetical protein HY717_21190 [Planctomycetes bacterium]|nr:hypothetical protein [Planctomycetota bacterium]
MNADRARILELIAQFQVDRKALDRSASEIASLRTRCPAPADGSPEIILYGYHLHQWYSAAENLLSRIAHHFGNEIERDEWHKGLLERLKLDVPGLRPPVLSQESFDHLNALRGFRHIFRHAYDYVLRWELMKPNVLRFPAAHQAFLRDLDHFSRFLQQLVSESGQ